MQRKSYSLTRQFTTRPPFSAYIPLATRARGTKIGAIPEGVSAIVDACQPPVCSSCGRIVEPYTRAVRFNCPNCGKTVIWRCEKCRKLAASYRCPSCGFEGP
ncbi:MAG: zinc finger domain-containing protein [Sulfolobales archaeon]